MAEDPYDTDTLLALLTSILPAPVPDQSVLLDALIHHGGNVQAAANKLLSIQASESTNSPKKRKRGLDAWLKPPSSSSSATTLANARYDSEDDQPRKARVTKLKNKRGTEEPPEWSSSSSSTPNAFALLMNSKPQSTSTIPAPLPSLPPLMLSTPALIEQHTPCTLHLSILPPELASRLFYRMIDEARDWSRNKWWLFDRLVESPHRTHFYVRKNPDNQPAEDDSVSWHEAAKYWYNGRVSKPPEMFPQEMEEACEYVAKVVNETLARRRRYALEWGGSGGQMWRANVAASNCYEGSKESVGPHSDQLTYLGPYSTIASISLGTKRTFRLRETIPTHEVTSRAPRTFNIPLPHNSLCIMHAGTQETFKHSIPPQNAIDIFHPTHPRRPGKSIEPSNCRINITFRFYRPDFHPDSIPRCDCDVPTILRPDMKGVGADPDKPMKYWWTCYAGAQNEGKGCRFWKVMDVKSEGRGPFMGSV